MAAVVSNQKEAAKTNISQQKLKILFEMRKPYKECKQINHEKRVPIDK